jgi:hypothetical protein
VKCFYSQQATDTIISPSDSVLNHLSKYNSWMQHADIGTSNGHITFSGPDIKPLIYPLYAQNGLWYYQIDNFKDHSPHAPHEHDRSIVNRLTSTQNYELVHARLGHPGERTMAQLHMHVDGLPKIVKPPMYKCDTCMLTKATKRAMTAKTLQEAVTEYKHQHSYLPSSPPHTPHTPQPLPKTSAPRGEPGTHFQMGMGFVRGTKYRVKDEDGNIITSLDGHNIYLIIIDRATRYTWVFLSKHNNRR